jgi:hypothetical protein
MTYLLAMILGGAWVYCLHVLINGWFGNDLSDRQRDALFVAAFEYAEAVYEGRLEATRWAAYLATRQRVIDEQLAAEAAELGDE